MAARCQGEDENSTPSAHKVRPRKPRSHSSGVHGRPPQQPHTITIKSGIIKHKEAKKTLLAIIRLHWPVGAYSYTEIERITNRKFTEDVLDEFHLYYTYDPTMPREIAISCVRKHIMGIVKRTSNEEKTRAYSRAKASGRTPFDHRPPYFCPDVWRYFCDHWVSEAHVAKSETSKKNREKLEVNHTAGAKPFDDVREELERSNGMPPSLLKLWETTHKRKGTGDWVTKAAKEIYERYSALASKQLSTTSPCTPEDEPLDLWLQATGGIKKNRIIGMPGVQASTVLSPVHCASESSKGEGPAVGPSKSGRNLSKETFVQVVEATLARLRSSQLYQEGRKLNRQTLQTLAQEALAAGEMGPDSGLSELIRSEALRVAVSLIENVLLGIEHEKEDCNIMEMMPISDCEGDNPTLSGLHSDGDEVRTMSLSDDEANEE